MILPPKFLENMKTLFPENEYGAFIASLSGSRFFGLRVNTLKTDAAFLKARLGFMGEGVPWCETGFYYDGSASPAKHPFYRAGLYYIQEPSAMAAAELLDISPGDRVLDVCAAPGGKTTALAAKLNGTGLIVSNDISARRCVALVKNVELAGIKNCVVTNEAPERLEARFAGFFDKIIIDAPCSGEGMFRKDPSAAAAWAAHKPGLCQNIQRELLAACAAMLRPGGVMAYSTCTFNADENERMISRFLGENAGFELVPVNHGKRGVSPGFGLSGAARLLPHIQNGEGHFVALVRKISGEAAREHSAKPRKITDFRPFAEFSAAFCGNLFPEFGRYEQWGGALYLLPEGLPPLDGIKTRRPGLYLGDLRPGGHFRPSHALAMSLKKRDFANSTDFPAESRETSAYLGGLAIENAPEAADGWTLVCCEGFPLGFGKTLGGRIKNYGG